MIEWRQQYADPERDQRLAIDSAVECDPSEDRALQAYKSETDINEMMRKFGITGSLQQSARQPMYGDFSEVVDYQSALNAVIAAQQSFMSLPSDVRARFGNDPARVLEFVANDENYDEAVKLGLVPAPARVPEPVSTTDVPE